MNEASERIQPEERSGDWRSARRARLIALGLNAEQVDRLIPCEDDESRALWEHRMNAMRQRLPTLGHFGGDTAAATVTFVQNGRSRVTPVAPRPTPIADESGILHIRFRAFADLSPAAIDNSVVVHLIARDGRARVRAASLKWTSTEGPVWAATIQPSQTSAETKLDLEGHHLQMVILFPSESGSRTH